MPSVEGIDDNVPSRGFGVRGRSENSNGDGVVGHSTGSRSKSGVYAYSDIGYGLYASSGSNEGVHGESYTGPGVAGYSNSSPGVAGVSINFAGVAGYSNNFQGVYGQSDRGFGVAGVSNTSSGVYGESKSSSGVAGKTSGWRVAGVYGANGSEFGYGVWGQSDTGIALYGLSNTGPAMIGETSGSAPAVYGFNHNEEGYGVIGACYKGTAIYGYTESGLAALLQGNVRINGDVTITRGIDIRGPVNMTGDVNMTGPVNITGPLTKPGGSFKIDHPLDPANKYLSHSFVESPDMKNVYDGVVTLDDKGEAEIELPDWFGALNKDFRYQLTAIGAPAPNLHISEEISDDAATSSNYNNHKSRFKVAGGTPGMKVSWQVTGIRKDPWANAHRISVEEDKPDKERGYYTYPELFMVSSQKRKG